MLETSQDASTVVGQYWNITELRNTPGVLTHTTGLATVSVDKLKSSKGRPLNQVKALNANGAGTESRAVLSILNTAPGCK